MGALTRSVVGVLIAAGIGAPGHATVPLDALSDGQMEEVHGALLAPGREQPAASGLADCIGPEGVGEACRSAGASTDARLQRQAVDDAERDRDARDALVIPMTPGNVLSLFVWPLVALADVQGEHGDGWFSMSAALDTVLRPVVIVDDDGYDGDEGHVRLEGGVVDGLRIRPDDPMYLGQRPSQVIPERPNPPAGDYVDIVFPQIIEGTLSVDAIKLTAPGADPDEVPSLGSLRIEGLRTNGSWIRIGVNP